MTRLRIVVGGFLGLLPAGGVTWDYVQYPAGFAGLGHDVFYIEDTRLWPIYQKEGGADCSSNVAHLSAVMEAFGLADRWAYRDEASGRCFGLPEETIHRVCRTADVFVNLSASTFLREEYQAIPVRVFIDSDPMFTQIQYVSPAATLTATAGGMRQMVDGHTHHFTFGENIGAADCRVPTGGIVWRPTRQPICLDHWPEAPMPADPEAAAFTTLMNWTAGPPLCYGGETWGQKDSQFRRFCAIPEAVPEIPLAVAVGQTTGAPFPADMARKQGWRVLDPDVCAGDWRAYRSFIQRSRGEFSIAKETYVKARTGWFSCRSACYLASGRPVITQDTGWSRYLPAGHGLLAFEDEESAADALRRVAAEPAEHGRAARAIAEECFDSDRVLGDLLVELGV